MRGSKLLSIAPHMTQRARPALIEADRVQKTYGGRAGGVIALEEVSFTIREGEFISIVGPSGCGKSTLLRLIGGLTEVTGGDLKPGDKVIISSKQAAQ